MAIFFKHLEVDYILFDPSTIKKPEDSTTAFKEPDVVTSKAKFEKDNKMKKYGVDDAGVKKYVVGEWLKFQIINDKPIMDQVHIHEKLVFDILAEGIQMCEIFQANVLIEKLPKS
ncbi:hypothetical protein ES332_A12G071400v1 [Gossypium tomentosum]|uniref:Uncharacterized protein n=1 Tax=Gossypium tomentosum TaxID=34277 RepID=A0A5D2MTI4_GOSTO|nr:hypothetical protein ES332_A12G071400v1 [Gossypium tomentosum]